MLAEPEIDPALARELGGPGIPICWDEQTSPGIEELVARVDAVVIPFGAVEQHGPHLPLGVDWQICVYVARGVSALTGVPYLPPVVYGVSASHGGFAGTVGVRPETLVALVGDMTDSLYRSGVRQFVLMNGHAWNAGSLDVCAEKLRTRYDDVRVRSLAYATMYPGPEIDGRVTYGRALMHANYFETSVMLAINPGLVRMDRAVSQQDTDSFWDYRTDQVSASGVWGRDIDQATAPHGAAEIERCIVTTARAVAAGVREPFPPDPFEAPSVSTEPGLFTTAPHASRPAPPSHPRGE
jgi:creatinine amidohydrolase